MKKFKNSLKIISLGVFLMIDLTSCTDWDEGYRTDHDVDKALLPVASFSASSTSILKGDSVTFTDTSTNDPSLFTWNFEGGDPTYSNQPVETVLYQGSGLYNVTLSVRNQYGADEIIMEKYIEVKAPPVVDIDTKAKIRYAFEDNLDSDLEKGILDIAATTSGAKSFTVRPGGGKAFVFNGSNPLVIPGYTGINGAGVRSVALWIKSTYANISGLVHWGASGSFSRSSFKWNKNGTIRFEYQGGGHNGTTIINDNKWHHVAYTYDGDTITLYVDGVEDFTISGKVLKTGEAGETDVTIGSQGGAAIWQGSMDDVRIFDVLLTPDEIKVLSEMK